MPVGDRVVVDHLWQSTLFAVCAGLLTLGFRRNRARIRYWLWFAASIKFLIPFSIIAAGVSALPWAPAVQAIAGSAISLATVQTTPPIVDVLSSPVASAAPAPAPGEWRLDIPYRLGMWMRRSGVKAVRDVAANSSAPGRQHAR